MLVYVALLVFMLVIIMEVVISIAGAHRMIKAARTVENSAFLTLERVSRELRQAEVNVSGSVLDTNPGKLALVGEYPNGSTHTTEFYLLNGKIMFKENELDVGALSEEEATVTSLIFTRFVSGGTEGVRTTLTLESGTAASYRTETFYSSTVLR